MQKNEYILSMFYVLRNKHHVAVVWPSLFGFRRLGNCWHSGIFCAWDASVTKHLKSKAHALSKISYRYLIQNSHKHLIHILTFQTSLPQSNIRSVSSNGCCSPICIVLFYIGLHQLEKAINLHSIHLYVMDAFGLIATFQDFSCQHKLPT